jgi:hypothetical protein
LKWGQKLCPNLLIKKRNTQLINGKPGKKTVTTTPPTTNDNNTYNTWGLLPKQTTPKLLNNRGK